jgi:hypothetical protein
VNDDPTVCARSYDRLRTDIREALQSREATPNVTVDVSLPPPLAMLLGHEWRQTTQLRVTVRTVLPGSGDWLVVQPTAPAPRTWPAPRKADLPGSGPAVLAVSVGATLGATVDRYAADHDARRLEHLHIDRDPHSDPLDADDIRALAAHSVSGLNELQAQGRSQAPSTASAGEPRDGHRAGRERHWPDIRAVLRRPRLLRWGPVGRVAATRKAPPTPRLPI